MKESKEREKKKKKRGGRRHRRRRKRGPMARRKMSRLSARHHAFLNNQTRPHGITHQALTEFAVFKPRKRADHLGKGAERETRVLVVCSPPLKKKKPSLSLHFFLSEQRRKRGEQRTTERAALHASEDMKEQEAR